VRLVLDTATLVASLRSDQGASHRLLAAGLRRRFTVLASVPLLLEYEAVLTRPEHLDAAGLTRDEVSVLLDAVAAVADPVTLHFVWRPHLDDPNDDMVLETAVNGHADLIATFDLRHFGAAARRFGIEALLPGACLRRLGL